MATSSNIIVLKFCHSDLALGIVAKHKAIGEFFPVTQKEETLTVTTMRSSLGNHVLHLGFLRCQWDSNNFMEMTFEVMVLDSVIKKKNPDQKAT